MRTGLMRRAVAVALAAAMGLAAARPAEATIASQAGAIQVAAGAMGHHPHHPYYRPYGPPRWHHGGAYGPMYGPMIRPFPGPPPMRYVPVYPYGHPANPGGRIEYWGPGWGFSVGF